MSNVQSASPAASFAGIFNKIAKNVRGVVARRAQRIALSELMYMSPARLDDLGITRHDLFEAINSPAPAAPMLESRRAARAERGFKLARA